MTHLPHRPPTHQDPMLAKVRKLLAKAEDPAATEHESEVYTAKAAQLIADYGIDRALLAQGDPASDPVGDSVVVVDNPYATDKVDLVAAVAQQLRCSAVARTRWADGGKERSVHLFGHASDLARVEMLYTSLLLQATTQLLRTPVPHGEHKAAFRRSWLAGFRMAVTRRLVEAEQRAEQDAGARFAAAGTSSELVLADRSAHVSAAVQETYPHLRTARPRSLSGSGVPQGWAAGQRADLGGSRVEPGRRRSLRPGA
ncbi:DUF2786 domain-containing protein [Nocardioides pacificus]